MDTNTAEKFVNLLAECAVSGSPAELRKEAAAQDLVKSANSLLWALPAVGAIGGGALGYFGTEDEKRKKRNAIYGALTGGLGLGLGGLLMNQGGKILNDATTGMADANAVAEEKTTGSAPPGVLKTPDGKTTGLGKVMEFIPGGEIPTIAADPNNPMQPDNVYGSINPYNIPGRVAGAGVGYAGGVSLAARANQQEYNKAVKTERGERAWKAIETALSKSKDLKPLRDAIGDVQSRVGLQPGGIRGATNKFLDFFRYRPRSGYHGAAADAINMRNYTSTTWPQWLRSFVPALRTPGANEARQSAKVLAQLATGEGPPPISPRDGRRLYEAAKRYEEAQRPGAPKRKIEDQVQNSLRKARMAYNSNSKLPARPPNSRKTWGRRGALAGSLLAHPYIVESILNALYGSKLVEDQPSP
jgi:hypothetical protein